MRRVVVTGVGLCTPVGNDTESTWSALVEGRSAVGPITGYDATSLQTQIGADLLGDYFQRVWAWAAAPTGPGAGDLSDLSVDEIRSFYPDGGGVE